MDRQRGSVHEALEAALDLERREVAPDVGQVVDPGEGALRAVGAVMGEPPEPQVLTQAGLTGLAEVLPQHALRVDETEAGERIGGEDGQAPQARDRHQVVERSAGVQHHHELPARLQHAVDLGLRGEDVRHVVQHAVAEHDVERVVGPRDVHDAPGADLVVGEVADLQPAAHPGDGGAGQVEPRPAGAAADELLGLGTLAKTDLEDATAVDVQVVEAGGDVVLQVVAPAVVRLEERLVVTAEAAVQASDERVAAGIRGPEPLDLRLVHLFRRTL